jgi:hypothetical protein
MRKIISKSEENFTGMHIIAISLQPSFAESVVMAEYSDQLTISCNILYTKFVSKMHWAK